MGCKQCCRSFGFTILSIITIGAACALFGVALYYIATMFKDVSNTLMVACVIALCVSILVFLFALYASVKDNRCIRTVLTFIYIIFAFVVGAAAILMFAFKGTLFKLIQGEIEKNNTDLIYSLEKAFDCKLVVNATTPDQPDTNSSLMFLEEGGNVSFYGSDCEDKINKFWKSRIPPIGGALIGIFVIIVIGIILSFKYICCTKDNVDLSPTDKSNRSKEQLNSPLTYGW
ncbi:hypothetical protein TRFO_12124 [Tritrichomonas foetus]|uniref:Tetraspanin family protein n=1 Tax=Tritrichomonas foetus TaxID=1144522 RepID=A0A1J4J5M6_9EUKA|nr:hypothetical protein TRFO_12124 [Tritrichomonas foetus]|eukprot:OHS92947.1 hypothetical protein TRFO_12124 [Tritrichomonas foetus]